MLVSTLFALLGLGALCWIVFNLAVYALPFAVGLTTAMYLYAAEQGVFLSIMAGLSVGCFIAVLWELAFGRVRSLPLRVALAFIYAVPAGIAGFHTSKALATFADATPIVSAALGWVGAFAVAGTALARISGWRRDTVDSSTA